MWAAPGENRAYDLEHSSIFSSFQQIVLYVCLSQALYQNMHITQAGDWPDWPESASTRFFQSDRVS